MSELTPSTTPRDLLGWPRNLTHCCECDQPFPEPVEQWDDYFLEAEDAAFMCKNCADEFDGTAANAR